MCTYSREGLLCILRAVRIWVRERQQRAKRRARKSIGGVGRARLIDYHLGARFLLPQLARLPPLSSATKGLAPIGPSRHNKALVAATCVSSHVLSCYYSYCIILLPEARVKSSVNPSPAQPSPSTERSFHPFVSIWSIDASKHAFSRVLKR